MHSRSLFVCILLLLAPGVTQAMDSVQLTDVIKSNGTGNINLFKDLTAAELESFRADNLGRLVFAVDVNEDASGTESSTSQGIALESVTPSRSFPSGRARPARSSGDPSDRTCARCTWRRSPTVESFR